MLDPLFSPRRMDAQEEDIAERVNRFIDTFVDRGSCNFTDEFAAKKKFEDYLANLSD